MVTKVIIEGEIKSDVWDELRTFLIENLPRTRGFEGCQSVEIAVDLKENRIVLDENWAETSNHKDYMAHIEKIGVLSQLAGFLKGPPVIRYFQLTTL